MDIAMARLYFVIFQQNDRLVSFTHSFEHPGECKLFQTCFDITLE